MLPRIFRGFFEISGIQIWVKGTPGTFTYHNKFSTIRGLSHGSSRLFLLARDLIVLTLRIDVVLEG